MPSSCKVFPEITTLLVENRLPTVSEGFYGTSKQHTKKLEAHSSEFCEADLVDQNMSIADLCSARLKAEDQRLNSDCVNGSYVVQEGSKSMKQATVDTEKNLCTSKHSEVNSQRNVGSREVGLVPVIDSPDVAVTKNGDCILNKRLIREESNRDTIPMNEKKSTISGYEDTIQLRNGFNIISDSSRCMVANRDTVLTESNATNQSQKEHLQFFGDTCGDYFDTVRQHAKLPSWDRPFKCNVCSITFKKEAHLKSHQSVHSDERPFGCGFCSKRFKRSDTLGIHERSHTGLKCHTCEICGKSYVSKFVLRRHKAIHSNERPFACDLCERKFRIKYDLTVHRRRHFDDKPFSCKECGKKFTNSAHVATHMLIHKNQRSFVCSECGKSFLRKEHMARHLSSVHIGERNYSCDVCKKRFKRPEVLRAHSLTHSRREEFICGQCGKSYSTKWNLKAHSVRHKSVKKLQEKAKVSDGGDS